MLLAIGDISFIINILVQLNPIIIAKWYHTLIVYIDNRVYCLYILSLKIIC